MQQQSYLPELWAMLVVWQDVKYWHRHADTCFHPVAPC
jgi:hypothetical protein